MYLSGNLVRQLFSTFSLSAGIQSCQVLRVCLAAIAPALYECRYGAV